MSAQFPGAWSNLPAPKNVSGVNNSASRSKRRRIEKTKEQANNPAGNNASGNAMEEDFENDKTVFSSEESLSLLQTQDLCTLVDKNMKKEIELTFEYLIAKLNSTRSKPDSKLQNAISAVVKALEKLAPTTRSLERGKSINGNQEQVSDLVCVSKAYEDANLREPIYSGEKKCIRGQDCECMFLDPRYPFIGMSYNLPQESSENINMCLVCQRAVVLEALVHRIITKDSMNTHTIQKFGNLHSKPGEYRASAMVFCPPSMCLHVMPLPVVRHQRNNYRVFMHDGKTYATQINVDFQ